MATADARIDLLLAEARDMIQPRATAEDLEVLVDAGALVIDTRPIEQRSRDGELPGAIVIDRNVLEWRLDPTSTFRIAEADDAARVVVVVCNEGFASSLAAATLRTLGLSNATDLDGGYQAWLAWNAAR
jgi:rhodanese-related sulfurtransferase